MTPGALLDIWKWWNLLMPLIAVVYSSKNTAQSKIHKNEAIIISYQLGKIHNSQLLNHVCNVVNCSNLGSLKQFLEQAKSPIWSKLGMAHQEK